MQRINSIDKPPWADWVLSDKSNASKVYHFCCFQDCSPAEWTHSSSQWGQFQVVFMRANAITIMVWGWTMRLWDRILKCGGLFIISGPNIHHPRLNMLSLCVQIGHLESQLTGPMYVSCYFQNYVLMCVYVKQHLVQPLCSLWW
jgi:hypothetical protein